jgi:hypothetical protein
VGRKKNQSEIPHCFENACHSDPERSEGEESRPGLFWVARLRQSEIPRCFENACHSDPERSEGEESRPGLFWVARLTQSKIPRFARNDTGATPWLLAGSLVLLAMMLGASFSRAEILDRVVASIGDLAITQSDVEQEYRLERFLDGQWPPPPPDSKTLEQARERLVYQKLLLEEETQDLSHDPALEKTAVEALDGIRKRFSSEQDYQSALHSLHLDEKQILATLVDQQRILRIIEKQLRPAAAPGTADVDSYYRDVFTPEYLRTHGPPIPPLMEVEGQIQEILVQKKIDQLLAGWLEELKPRRRVRFYSF